MNTATSRTVEFDALPDDARVWIFTAARPLRADERARLLARVDRFLEAWHAHGHPVVGARELRDDRVLLIGADERATGVSGCSIDSLYRVLKELEAEMSAGMLDGSRVHFRGDDGSIRSATRSEFAALAESGTVDGETVVLDSTIRTVGELDGLEKPARESWHRKAFLDRVSPA